VSRISERIARMKDDLRQLNEERMVKVIIAPWARVHRPREPQNGARIDDRNARHGEAQTHDALAGGHPRGARRAGAGLQCRRPR